MQPRTVVRVEAEEPAKRLAVLIDADNAQAAVIEGLLEEVARWPEKLPKTRLSRVCLSDHRVRAAFPCLLRRSLIIQAFRKPYADKYLGQPSHAMLRSMAKFAQQGSRPKTKLGIIKVSYGATR